MDLNADLGESFGSWNMGDDAAMFRLVTSANVACGLHAGDPVTMLDSCRAAFELDVTVGAHVGYRDLAGFGRRSMDMSFDELFGDVLYQLGALDGVAHAVGASVDYVKPHGALYNRLFHDADQASAVVAAIQAYDPGLPILGLPGSELLVQAREAGHPVFVEAFVDRAYQSDGTLVPRSQEGALLHDLDSIVERAVRLAIKGEVVAVDGTVVQVRPDSLCIHGDTPGAVEMATRVRAGLEAAGVALESFAH
ncbi:LamB/YcsF family protein [Arthrobacter sp. HMWF013]|uniref:LamB/YcsF family protein n=1 Tax=Arthrobacter sp. HMWF013 TaxID=2056849 RepID=UPI000D397E1F|nr:5-oxoprolinase subunit PxpA [Arthrobacter sp. HMWF013]PTT62560.1 LamB/YcsF family protein [Arthrobacter sp. HMWF013]